MLECMWFDPTMVMLWGQAIRLHKDNVHGAAKGRVGPCLDGPYNL